MKKHAKNWTLALLIAMVSLAYPLKVRAEDETAPSSGGERIQSIVTESETSIVYDCGMYPAEKVPVSEIVYGNPVNQYQQLKAPAMVTKIGKDFFIVDTYHNQVLYAGNLQTPIQEWKVLEGDLALPHGIAGDGDVYLVTDTDRNQIKVYQWVKNRYQNTQILTGIGIRPHAIWYDETTAAFWVWSAYTGEMYLLKKDVQTGIVCIQQIRQVKELHGEYVRSFRIVNDEIWFPSGSNGYITIADKETFTVTGRYPVTDEIAGMADICPAGEFVYLTVSTDIDFNQNKATMIRVKNLADLATGNYEKIYDMVGKEGVPYYMTSMEEGFFVTTHGSEHSLWKLKLGTEGKASGIPVY